MLAAIVNYTSTKPRRKAQGTFEICIKILPLDTGKEQSCIQMQGFYGRETALTSAAF